ncbi:hypothetical protein Taro_041652 [Colocasia esculenta]|uniref:Uncharacterized protein n=1 Tax=Colocasia esculenta TaxID=4460 RepID=A0A843WWG6_COLES|nr:hypothetical protein [Colocasia esculenta]
MVATETGTETSLTHWTMQQGARTRLSTPCRSLLNTVRDTNSEMSGRMLNNVRLNSRTPPARLPPPPTARTGRWWAGGDGRLADGRDACAAGHGGRASRVVDGDAATARGMLRGRTAVEEKEDRQINVVLPHQLFKTMSSSNRAPQRDGKTSVSPPSPVPSSPPARPAPQAQPSPPSFSPDYWNSFYIGWKIALHKASQLYDHKGLTNILPDISPRAEHICSSSPSPSPARSSSSPPSSIECSGYGV